MADNVVKFQAKKSPTSLFDSACETLADPKTAGQVGAILDPDVAQENFARLVEDRTPEGNLKAFRMIAKRHLGQQIKAAKAAGERRGSGRPSLKNKDNKPSETSDNSRQRAHEAEKLASLTETEFQQKVAAITAAAAAPKKPRAPRKPKAAAAPPVPVVVLTDAPPSVAATPGPGEYDKWMDRIPADVLLKYVVRDVPPVHVCKALMATGVNVTVGNPEDTEAEQERIKAAAAERARLLQQVKDLEQERDALRKQIAEKPAPGAGAAPVLDLVGQLLSMPVAERQAVLCNVANHPPMDDPRARQEWSKSMVVVACAIYAKVAGTKDDPWKWRKKIHRLIKLPPDIDPGKASLDDIGPDPTTADESAMGAPAATPTFDHKNSVVTPPLAAAAAAASPPLPKLDEDFRARVAESDTLRRDTPPGSLLKQDKPTRRGNGHDRGGGFP